MHRIVFYRSLTAAALLLSVCGQASADATAATGAQSAEPVVVIDGKAVSRDEFRKFMAWRATQRGGAGKPEQALDDLIDLRILSREAERRKLGERDDVKRQLDLARANVLATALLEDMRSAYGITEKDVRREYDQQVKSDPGAEPVPYPLARRQISQMLVSRHLKEQMGKLRSKANVKRFSLIFLEENED
ncbi:MAG: hypothetical protein A3F73_02030 [Gallionellales bacterium RIFCSPLOWO2_12_FULL_59_22]|nr:MAG: hypothetical protein A3H99_04435 [Gallionellales bacterium RIFCSPLOWO2_02_FULL_59_110]OGT12310.1 MAG: hypothetical protein A3F73_02030 [Gallionellales bacterium RIFCSPLOWO2_12_FULL_59_22]